MERKTFKKPHKDLIKAVASLDAISAFIKNESDQKIVSDYMLYELTYNQVGEKHDMSGNWVRQLVQRYLRRLRHNLKPFPKDYHQIHKKVKRLEAEISSLKDGMGLHAMPINDLNLSARAYNSIVDRAGVKTIGDLVEKTEQDLLRNRQFGKKTLMEVISALKNKGLSLANHT